MRAGKFRRLGAIISVTAAAAAVAGLALPAIAAPAKAQQAQAASSVARELRAVSCPGATRCTAVGGAVFLQGRAIVRSWNGQRWTSPLVGSTFRLLGVSCRSGSQCTAVGETAKQRALVLRWNGTKWLVQPTPSTPEEPLGYSFLFGVSCPSATACVAAGTADGLNLVERWNGSSWSIQSVPVPSGTRGEGMFSVSCPSAVNCTALGEFDDVFDVYEPLAEHWNGGTWTIQSMPNVLAGAELVSVSCPNTGACVAVGNEPIGGEGPPLPLAEAWTSAGWRRLPTAPHPDKYAVLSGVSCTSARFCIAVGNACTAANACVQDSRTGFRAFALRWNGRKWTTLRTPEPVGTDLEAVSCSSWRACTAVGRTATALVAERWNGTRWTRQGVPS